MTPNTVTREAERAKKAVLAEELKIEVAMPINTNFFQHLLVRYFFNNFDPLHIVDQH